jgi:hypothetical protein
VSLTTAWRHDRATTSAGAPPTDAATTYDRHLVDLVVWIVGGLAVFAVAAVAVGRVTSTLATDPERAVFDVEQSVSFVAEALPGDVTAELSYDDVTVILRIFHDYLHERGVATTAGEDDEVAGPQIVDPAEGIERILLRTRLAGVTYRPSDVEAVVEAQMAYFAAIGVIGEEVESPEDLDLDGSDPDDGRGGVPPDA